MFLTIAGTLTSLSFVLLLILSLRRDRTTARKSLEIQGLSIVIPFRNEAPNFPLLIHTLTGQKCSFPYEIILVDDHSDDNYGETLMPLLEKYPQSQITVLTLEINPEAHLTSKQQALDFGVSHARYDWLVFTDADMFFTQDWLESLVKTAQQKSANFVFGRTGIKHQDLFSFLQHMQLQFLFVIAQLFSISKIDSSCMGNNILLKKELYDTIGGQKGIGYSIVEDQALLHALRREGITPTPALPFSLEAHTYPEKHITGYFHQVLRWSKGGAGGSLQLLGAMALLLLYLSMIPLSIHSGIYLPLAGASLTLFIYLFRGYVSIGEGWLFLSLPLLFVWILIEAVCFLPFALFIKPVWKERRL